MRGERLHWTMHPYVSTVIVTDMLSRGVTRASMLKALKIPGVLLASASIIVTSISIGFLQATLEPHFRQFMLSPVVLGLMFVINGGTYAALAPFCGWCCDKIISPKLVTFAGTIFVALGFTLIGPAPFLPLPTILWVSVLGLVLHGVGIAAQLVASFTDSLRTSVAHGFPNNLETFGLISGLWTSTFALGAFIGPSVSGILYDNIGFRNASIFVVGLHLLVGFLVAFYLCFNKSDNAYVDIKEEKWNDKDTASGSIMSFPQKSTTESMHSIRSVNGISIEKSRPPCMNSLIACTSYKSHAWPEHENGSVTLGPYSYTYGAIGEQRNGILRNPKYFKDVA